VPDAIVVFELTSAGDGAAIIPDTARTGTDGRAQVHLLLGDKVGVQTGEARVVVDTGTAPVVPFTAVATSNPGNPDNHPPRADFHSDCGNLTCQFTDASNDSDGSVTGWSWQFGDGATSGEQEPSHAYATAGTYLVTLTITDNGGATDQTTKQIQVSGAPQSNRPPTADFDIHCHDEDCSFTDKSRDEDGTVTTWLWQFGDGFVSVEQNPQHSYESRGHYQVTLTVTDNDGASGTKTHDAKVKD
jgi:PKD repeat protein